MTGRNKIVFALKAGFSVCLMAWIVYKVDLAGIVKIISSAKIGYLSVVVAWLILDRVLMSWRWDILLKAKRMEIPFFQIVKMYFLGSFAGNFLPSSIAPDAVRAYLASKFNYKASDIISSVFIDRILGLFALAIVATCSILYLYSSGSPMSGGYLFIIISIYFIVAMLIVSEKILDAIPLKKIGNFFGFKEDGFLWKNLEKLYLSINDYRKNGRSLMAALLLSLGIQVLAILTIYLLAVSIDIRAPLVHYFVFIPLINIIIMLPISVGGIGVQEGAFIYLFDKIGVASQEALTLALLFRALTVMISLPGGYFYATEGDGRKVLSSR